MAPALASSLTISAAAYLGKAFLGVCAKSVRIEGLPILLEALRDHEEEGMTGKGKEKALGDAPRRRRGVVSGQTA